MRGGAAGIILAALEGRNGSVWKLLDELRTAPAKWYSVIIKCSRLTTVNNLENRKGQGK